MLQSMGSRHAGFGSCGSWALKRRLSSAAHGLSCSVACGIFLDQGLNPCPLHLWQILNHCTTKEAPDQLIFFFLKYIIYLFIYLWLCWVFVSVQGLSPVVASGGHSSSRCAGLSLSQPLLLRSTDSRCAGSVIVAHGSSCSVARVIFPDQDSNPCPLHQQADSQPLRHQGSPPLITFYIN